MRREELERLIVDASDGVLNAEEIQELENELQNHPELFEDYRAIINLPDMTNLYRSDLEFDLHQSSIHAIKRSVREMANRAESFEVITLDWFRKYALAASIVIFAITSVFSFIQIQDEPTGSEEVIVDYFYPAEESSIAENYVSYLEEIARE